MICWNLQADLEEWETVSEDIAEELKKIEWSLPYISSFLLALDEAFSNIARYAYSGKTGQVKIMLEKTENQAAVTFQDSGIPFNPLEQSIPGHLDQSAGKRPCGGLGIYLIRSQTDHMNYRYKDGENILTLVKCIGQEDGK